MKKQTLAFLIMLLGSSAAIAAQGPYCGELRNGVGPWDYRIASAEDRHLVESFHFTDPVENLVAGATGTIAADLDYTLRAFPNHARALTSLLKLAKRMKQPKMFGATYPVECYFERAVRFQPDDPAAWALWAQYLYSQDQSDRALPMLEKAAELAPDNPSYAYNMGLALAKQKKFDAALPWAHKAYSAEFPLPGLRQMLVNAGKWTEPPPRPKAEEPAGTDAKPEAKADGAPDTKPASATAPAAAAAEPKAETKPEAKPAMPPESRQ